MCMTPLLYSKGDWQPSGRTCNGGVLNCSLLLVKVHVVQPAVYTTGCTTGCKNVYTIQPVIQPAVKCKHRVSRRRVVSSDGQLTKQFSQYKKT